MCAVSHASHATAVHRGPLVSETINGATNSLLLGPSVDTPAALSHLVYLGFFHDLTLADLTYLLDDEFSTVFAAHLTRLRLRVHQEDKTAAAVLLPSLPSMYSSLTHTSMGVQPKWSTERPSERLAWDAAVWLLRAAGARHGVRVSATW